MNPRSVRAGVVATAALVVFYVAVVGGVGGVAHLGQQVATDWP